MLTITGRNEAIIVELKELFVLNGTFIKLANLLNGTFKNCGSVHESIG